MIVNRWHCIVATDVRDGADTCEVDEDAADDVDDDVGGAFVVIGAAR